MPNSCACISLAINLGSHRKNTEFRALLVRVSVTIIRDKTETTKGSQHQLSIETFLALTEDERSSSGGSKLVIASTSHDSYDIFGGPKNGMTPIICKFYTKYYNLQ